MKKVNFTELIIFENEDYVVINKPPHLSTLDDRTPEGKQNILKLAREYVADAQVCHRLDKETSGALALAKNPEAYRHLSMQFEHRKVNKIYHAVVDGIKQWNEAEVNRPILPLNNGTVKIDYELGKDALTYFQTIEIFRKHSMIECRPLTGRMHQIRIHLSVLGTAIVGDAQYGGLPVYLSELKRNFNLKKDAEELPLIQRFALHAHKLEFSLLDQTTVSIEAPYPKDFKALLIQLRKFV
ncbi:MAG: RNA pseudouridine synthase [Microscillaceae bacterium]|jgi:23S rRNA pseudouridine955/2504/2580 synthase|nr:RNA pseudouridine synthase [Microscillaceae bacterium]